MGALGSPGVRGGPRAHSNRVHPVDTVPSAHVRGDLELAREIHRLRERGLGYRRIGKALGMHYKRVERLYKKYLSLLTHVKVTRSVDGSDGSDGSDGGSRLVGRNVTPKPVDSVTQPLTNSIGRLGRTQRLILDVMSEQPGSWWTISAIRNKLRLLRYLYTRQALFEALKRLRRRGLIEYMPSTLLVSGEKVLGLYRLRFYVSLDSREVLVHNMRVSGMQIVSKERDGEPKLLSEALFRAHLLGKTWPVDQVELHNDYHVDTGVTQRLRGLGWRMTVVYSPRPGVIRFEHRLWRPEGLIASPDQKPEWLSRYESFTSMVSEIAYRELSRLNTR